MLWSPLLVVRDISQQMTVNSMEGKISRENLPRAIHFSYRIDLVIENVFQRIDLKKARTVTPQVGYN